MDDKKQEAPAPHDPMAAAVLTVKSELSIVKKHKDGTLEDFGVVSRRLVTAAGVKWLTDLLAGTAAGEMKYHASGTDNTAEAVGDTALIAEVATRVVGTKVSAAVGNNATYTSVATIPYTGTLSIVEHGLLSADPAGTLLDRSVFAAKAVDNGDELTFTYVLTVNSGG